MSMPDERLSRCVWPTLEAPFDAALRDATAFALRETDPIGIIVTGTIVRGEAHASSDLDVYVIHTAPFRRRVQRFFRGVPTEIFINPPTAVRRYFADEHRDGRLFTAHMLATGVVAYSSSPVVDELRTEASDWLRRPAAVSEAAATRARYGIATRLEDGADVASSDGATSAMLLTQAVASMLEYFCMARMGRIPRSKELIAAARAHDPEVGRFADAFFGATTPAERVVAANGLADLTIGTRGFFEWDSGQEPVAE